MPKLTFNDPMKAGQVQLCHDFNLNRKIVIKYSRYTGKSGNIMLQENVPSRCGILKPTPRPARTFFLIALGAVAVDTGFLQGSWRMRKPKYVPGQHSRPTGSLFDNPFFYGEKLQQFVDCCVSREKTRHCYPGRRFGVHNPRELLKRRKRHCPRRQETEGTHLAGGADATCFVSVPEKGLSRCNRPGGGNAHGNGVYCCAKTV